LVGPFQDSDKCKRKTNSYDGQQVTA
jgi:hypothetical protein